MREELTLTDAASRMADLADLFQKERIPHDALQATALVALGLLLLRQISEPGMYQQNAEELLKAGDQLAKMASDFFAAGGKA